MVIDKNQVARLSNNEIVILINNINALLNKVYEIRTGRGCKWANVRTLTTILNQNNYSEQDITTNSINRFINTLVDVKRHQIREQDDKLFSELKQYKVNDPYDTFVRISNQNKFEKWFNNERQIIKQKHLKKQSLEQIINNKPLLRPLPPKTNKQPTPYIKKRFEKDNKSVIEFINNNSNFVNECDKYLIVNEPHDLKAAITMLKHYNKFKDEKIEINSLNDEPIVDYYFNHIRTLENIYNALEKVFRIEYKPFKLQFTLSGVFEEYNLNQYEYTAEKIYWAGGDSIPIIIKSYEDLSQVKQFINATLSHYQTSTSSKLLSIVASVCFRISKLIKISGKINGLPEEFIKSHAIIVDNEDDGLCFYRFLACCLDSNLTNAKSFNLKNRTSKAKALLLEKYGIKFTSNMTQKDKQRTYKILSSFKGINQYEMKEEVINRKLNVNIFDYDEDKKRYDIIDTWIGDKTSKTYHNALIYSNKNTIHIMFIKPDKLQILTDFMFCPKCRLYTTRGKNKVHKMNKHIKHCDGVFKKELFISDAPLPYCPHIINNGVYQYCLAHNLEWKPFKEFITYDFETIESVIDNNITNSTVLNSVLNPISVASSVKTKDSIITKSFDARTDEFIPKWIIWLFEQAERLYIDKINYLIDLLKLDLVNPFTSKLGFKTNYNERYDKRLFKQKQYEDIYNKLRKIDKNINVINVFGYNSSRFDSNLFKQYFNYCHNNISWRATSLIGNDNSLKQFILSSPQFKVCLRFVDAQSHVAGGSLKQFCKDFGGENDLKGCFPYEAINSNNYKEELDKTEPFKHEDFYSYLHKSNLLTPVQYDQYIKDYIEHDFKNRWEYLLYYNENDVKIMIKPILKLIEMNAAYNVDLQNSLSLSSNASSIKYALACKDFNPKIDYGIINKKTTFQPNKTWWSRKCDNYYNQDKAYNEKIHKKMSCCDKITDEYKRLQSKLRDLSKCVCTNDFKDFMKLYNENGVCYLCGEHFTESNKPTLDRINNDKGHELDNCKLACAVCNRLHNRNDEKITRLLIQLNKFWKINHLPTTLTNKTEYKLLRESIFGGLSIVFHRVNISGLTHINLNRYDSATNKIINFDTGHIITHIIGSDFNSLYPSSYSSIKHPFNPYTGGKMWMPGELQEIIEVYKNGVKNEEAFNRCVKIITDKNNMFANEPEYVFIAKVKLKCPKELINDFINFPPIFRKKTISNKPDEIGEYMHNVITQNNLSVSEKEDKLTFLIDTGEEFMPFNSYYLWLLLDLGLELVDIEYVMTYNCHDRFKYFVEDMMRNRIMVLVDKNGNEKFYKINMNGSYGYDGMNTEKFNKVSIVKKDKAYTAIISDTYRGGYKLSDDYYLITKQPKYFKCNTPLQEAVFTLDNAKFWYLTFIYKFMFRCLDMTKLHLTTADTDSAYFAVSGNPNEDGSQAFKYIVKDHEFYNKYIYTFMPDPNINSMVDTKKILGCCIEKYGDIQIALSPKCYTIRNFNDDVVSLKIKGVSQQKNNITSKDFDKVINDNIVIKGMNINLQMNNHKMSKITVSKNALTNFNNKVITLPNGACVPYINGLTAKDIIMI